MKNYVAVFDELKSRMLYLETATKLYRELIIDLSVHKHIPDEYVVRLADISSRLIGMESSNGNLQDDTAAQIIASARRCGKSKLNYEALKTMIGCKEEYDGK